MVQGEEFAWTLFARSIDAEDDPEEDSQPQS
jgi:hypothetical protein